MAILLVILPSSFFIPLNGQTPEPEKIHIHFDKSFYLVGETIHFKIYFKNKNEVLSKIVHVDMVDDEGNILLEQILEIDQNTTSGSFEIPYNFIEANYLFRCYTQWNLNFGSAYIYYKIIPVYNVFLDDTDLEFVVDTTKDTTIPKLQSEDISNRLNLRIKNTGTIHRNDRVEIEISLINKEISGPVNLSISAIQLSAFNNMNPDSLLTSTESATQIEGDPWFEPEDSIRIKGIAYDPETGEILRSRVLSIYNIENASFTRLSSKTGFFEFKVPIFQGSSDFQIINMNPFQPRVPDIEWIPINKELPPDPDFSNQAIRNNRVKEYIFYARLRNRINEIFFSSVYDSIQLQQPLVLPFAPDRSYDMSKYQLIRDLFNFFKEGVTSTNFYKENGQEKIRLFNKETKKYFMTSPWFVVDGHFIFNDSIVHHIPFNHLSRIDIYNSNTTVLKYFEPIMIQGGVVAVYTKNNFLIDYIREMPNTLHVNGVPESKSINVNGEYISSGKKHETPDFNPQIYWNGEILTDENGMATVSFNTNDVTGTIIIKVNGFDVNGRLLSGHLTFVVEP